ncbi:MULTISPECIES: glycosyltransferase [unclassified Variovorax]|uniref:glycosyltransferase n=1 Tax=unclassified Variovorax TaxID=663243 RepID=UPI001BD50D1B|nr:MULTISPECIES: glycosyltransferase [unclassified Variovorax]
MKLLDRASLIEPARLVWPCAWVGHIPFASWVVGALRPSVLVELGLRSGNAFNTFCQAVAEQALSTRTFAVPKGDAQALTRLRDGSVDLLHIGRLHASDEALVSFEAWLPKLSDRSVVLLSNIEVRRSNAGASRLWEELLARFPGFAFTHANGLGVLLVGARVPEPLRELAEGVGAAEALDHAQEIFEILGQRLEQQAAMQGGSQRLANPAPDIVDALIEQAALLDEKLAIRDAEVRMLTDQRDAQAAQVAALRRSGSWRITAPVRLAGLIARGRFRDAGQRLKGWRSRARGAARGMVERIRGRMILAAGTRADDAFNRAASDALVDERNELTSGPVFADPMTAPAPAEWPRVDMSVVTFNSKRWIDSFVDSLEALDYPKVRIHLRFVDNQSTDGTPCRLQEVFPRLRHLGMTVDLIERPNLGFGAGHNAGLAGGSAEFCLVANIDLEFVPDALSRVVAMAAADAARAVAWEFRQKPYEHPKVYDPVTGTTTWNSHACVLLRRSAFDAAGGYDPALFMYGEDVELSYRLRQRGGLLRYCPAAVVMHYSYESAGQVKPLQFTGSTFASLYLRVKYGSRESLRHVPGMGLALLAMTQTFPGARRAVFKNLLRLLARAPTVLCQRKASQCAFPFRGWDYERVRDGAFVESGPLPANRPLVSVITRTYRGRDRFLRQAMLSVAHQTYPEIEHVVVEDGSESLRSIVDEVASVTGRTIRYFAIGKAGRSAAGNAGLAAARGRWCVFLDDDDLLFADHVEVLAQALGEAPGAVAAYSPAIEVLTHYPSSPSEHYREAAYVMHPAHRQPFDGRALRNYNYIAIQSLLFERRLYLERGGFELDLDALEDWVLWNLYACRNTFAYVPKATSLYRVPADEAIRNRRNDSFVATHAGASERIAMRLLEVSRSALRRQMWREVAQVSPREATLSDDLAAS